MKVKKSIKKKVNKSNIVSAKTVRKAIALLNTPEGATAFKKSVVDFDSTATSVSKSNDASEKDLRWELKRLQFRLEIVESLLLEIESKKPDLSTDERTRIKQARCDHRKGGAHKFRSAKDYALRDHTFIDGSRQVRCTICGKVWTPNSKEWFKALEMLEQTTNTRTSSEILAVVTPFALVAPRETYSVQEVKDAYRPRNAADENPIRGQKVPK